METVERLYRLIAVADDLLVRRSKGQQVDVAALLVAHLIGHEIEYETHHHDCAEEIRRALRKK